MKLSINLEFEPTSLPNFLRLRDSKGAIDIGNLSDAAYQEFENQYIERLRRHWQKRKQLLNK